MTRAIAAIAGVAEADLGSVDRTAPAIQAQAVLRALDDCGLSLRDVDGLATTGLSRFSVTHMAEYLGIQPTWLDATMIGGSSYELFLARAARAVAAGLCEVAVVSYGSNQRSARRRRLGGLIDHETPESQFEAVHGPLIPISAYALCAQRHMHEYGTSAEQLAAVAVAARQWALLNPVAFRHAAGPLSIDEVVASPMVSSPLHTLDCCLVTDGGGAVVVTSVARARSLAKPPVLVLGHGEISTHQSIGAMTDLTWTGAAKSSRRAYAMAHLGPADIDVVQLYDSFTITVLLSLEALGFCPRGESGRFVEGGTLGPGGSFPINTSGGGLSYTQPGMFGIFLIIEAVRQLRGECGARQLRRHDTALCHGTGGILSTHATVILGGDHAG